MNWDSIGMNLGFIQYEAHTHVHGALIHNAFIEKGLK